MIVLLLGVLMLAGCFSSSQDKLRQRLPDQGVSAVIQIDLPDGASHAQVAATVVKDRLPVPLVAGDVFKASSDAETVILRAIDNLDGDYRGMVAVPNPALPLAVNIAHDALGAREDRWYPVDQLLVDPGPGELVGYDAQVILPQALVISSPQADEVYTDRSDVINLSWLPGDGEQMRLGAVLSCGDAQQQFRYATSRVLGTDDGQAELRIGDLVPDSSVVEPVVDVFTRLAVVLMAALLEYTTLGLLDGSDWHPPSFTLTYCDIALTLFREKTGTLAAEFDGGYAVGSRSVNVAIRYEPAI
jgi:hypothetical protein